MSQNNLVETPYIVKIYCMEEKKNQLKRPEQITSIVYFHVILFRIHERDTAREKEFDGALTNDTRVPLNSKI